MSVPNIDIASLANNTSLLFLFSSSSDPVIPKILTLLCIVFLRGTVDSGFSFTKLVLCLFLFITQNQRLVLMRV
jgi:hypothetical protein